MPRMKVKYYRTLMQTSNTALTDETVSCETNGGVQNFKNRSADHSKPALAEFLTTLSFSPQLVEFQ